MTSVRNVRSTVLSGPRVELRPLRSSDFEGWHDVRTRSRDWLEPWEPLADPGSPDPVTDPEAFRARCGAWERQRHFDTAYGFEELHLHRIEAAIVPRNSASRRVAHKLGLRDEGVAERFLQIRGVWEDHVRYAITSEEWGVRRDEITRRFLT